MSTIKVGNLSKTFIYHKKAEGLRGSFNALFKREKLEKRAVRDISFEIGAGEFVGFLGPNGAGKTTTLKMLSGVLAPTSGSMSVLGYNPTKRQDEFKKKISIVMGQRSQLWFTLPAIESLNLLQKIYEVPECIYRKRLKELSGLMNVEDLLHVQLRKLSLGQRMKLELIGALLHNPKVLFLDEPTIGLDIIAKKNIWQFLSKYNKKNKATIILTSHYMEDIKNLCKRLIVINEGKIILDDSLDGVIKRYSKNKILNVSFYDKIEKEELSRFGKIIKSSFYSAEIALPESNIREKISLLVSKFPVKNLNIQDVALDEIITDIFKKG